LVNKDWIKAQKHEKEYYDSGKNKQWQTPHSLSYWLNFLQIKTLNDKYLEIGCGPNGLYHFTDTTIGIDSINHHRKNFIISTGEFLPFKQNSFITAICCNSLDHCKDPKQVISEMIRTSNNLIIWSNVFPSYIKYIMNKTDSIHLYHFTKTDLQKLFPHHTITKQIQKSIFSWHGKIASRSGKFKLFIASLLGIKGICLHMEIKE